MVKMRRVESNVDVDPKKLEDLLSRITFKLGYDSYDRKFPSFSYEETFKTDKFLKFFESYILKRVQNVLDDSLERASKSKKPMIKLVGLYDAVKNASWKAGILNEWVQFRSPAYSNNVLWKVFLSLGMKDVSLRIDVDRPYTSVYSNGDDFVNGRPYYAGMSDSEIEGIQKFFDTQIAQDRDNLYNRIEDMFRRIKPKLNSMKDKYIKDLQDLIKEDRNKTSNDFDGYTVSAELSDGDDRIIAEYGPYPFGSKRFIEDLKSVTDDIYEYMEDGATEDDYASSIEESAYLDITVTTPDNKDIVFSCSMDVEGKFGIDRYTNISLDLSIKYNSIEYNDNSDLEEDDEEVDKVEKGLEKLDIPSLLTADY